MMSLTAETVQLKLTPRPTRFYKQVDSTNDLALDWLREGAPSGAVVVADEQLKGRGRLGRAWYTPMGTAVIVSVVLHPKVEQLPQISMLGAVAIAEMIERLIPSPPTPQSEGSRNLPPNPSVSGRGERSEWQVGIKWPNDVQLNGRKVSGVLAEAVWEGEALRGVVLGMGVNARIDFTGTELAETAISLEAVLGKRVERVELLADLLASMDEWYEQLGSPALFDEWKGRLTTLGQMVHIGEAQGVAEAVDKDGALLVRDANGGLHRVVAGDILLGSA